jgi:hypothetical protein
MYSAPLANRYRFQTYFPYYPVGSRDSLADPDNRGIGATCSSGINTEYPYLNCELHRWSGGGINFGNTDGGGNRYNEWFSNSFWSVQINTPPPPLHVEWSTDYYPLVPSNDASLITDLIEYLTPRFTTVYVGPNCTLGLDISRTPNRQTVSCDLNDQNDDSLWTVSAHP